MQRLAFKWTLIIENGSHKKGAPQAPNPCRKPTKIWLTALHITIHNVIELFLSNVSR